LLKAFLLISNYECVIDRYVLLERSGLMIDSMSEQITCRLMTDKCCLTMGGIVSNE